MKFTTVQMRKFKVKIATAPMSEIITMKLKCLKIPLVRDLMLPDIQ